MALDTAGKRLSAINWRTTGRRTLPLSTGSFDLADRQWLLTLYSGNLIFSIVIPDLCYPLLLVVPLRPSVLLGVPLALESLLDVPDIVATLMVTTTGETRLEVLPCD